MLRANFDANATSNAQLEDVASRWQVRACQQGGDQQGTSSARPARLSRSRGDRGDNNDDDDDDRDDDDDGDGDDNRDGDVDDNDDVKWNGGCSDENGQARGAHDGVQRRGSIAVVRAHAPVPGEQLRASP